MNNTALEYALVLSTGHIPDQAAEDDFLGFDYTMPRISSHENGWIIFLTEQEDRPVPKWFQPILAYAIARDVSFLIFDSDSQEIEGLPVYPW